MNLANRILLKSAAVLAKRLRLQIPARALEKISGLVYCDVGSSGGIDEKYLWLCPAVDFVGFEPDERSIELTTTALKNQGFKSVKLFPYAVGSGQLKEIFLTRKPTCSSLLEPNRQLLNLFPHADRFDLQKKISVEVKGISSVSMKIDWLKVDVQGAELDVLKGLPSGVEQSPLVIEAEVEFIELYSKQDLFEDLLLNLKRNYTPVFLEIVNWRSLANLPSSLMVASRGRLAFGNCVWLRKDLCPESFVNKNQSEVLKAAAILVGYRQFALAQQLLELSGSTLKVSEFVQKNYRFNLLSQVVKLLGFDSENIFKKFYFDQVV